MCFHRDIFHLVFLFISQQISEELTVFSKVFLLVFYNSIKQHRHCKKPNPNSVKCPLLSNPDMNNNCQYIVKSSMSLIAISWCPLQTCSQAHRCSQLLHRTQGFQCPWQDISLAYKAVHERREDIKSNSSKKNAMYKKLTVFS